MKEKRTDNAIIAVIKSAIEIKFPSLYEFWLNISLIVKKLQKSRKEILRYLDAGTVMQMIME